MAGQNRKAMGSERLSIQALQVTNTALLALSGRLLWCFQLKYLLMPRPTQSGTAGAGSACYGIPTSVSTYEKQPPFAYAPNSVTAERHATSMVNRHYLVLQSCS